MDIPMSNNSMVWTAESVTEGHPDKMCDQISDAILDDVLHNNSGEALEMARVACETTIKRGPIGDRVNLIGEITSEHFPNYEEIVRQTIASIGYNDDCGFNPEECSVMVNISQQSKNIKKGTDKKKKGAGDQGMMFGYACRETPTLMPAPIFYAHKLASQLSEVRRKNEVPSLRPDGKSQITLKYENGVPVTALKIVLAAQHGPKWNSEDEGELEKLQGELKELLHKHVVEKVIPESFLDGFNWKSQFTVNGTGAFELGGPAADAGLTGRKIIVDTYGGMAPHGGGAFSGKDPTKVDRSANYYARYCAKNIVAAGLAERCEVRVAYAIGESDDIGLYITTFGTEQVELQKIHNAVRECFDFKPENMIDQLKLRRPIYRPFAAYGHFGREEENATWEKTDKVDDLRSACGL